MALSENLSQKAYAHIHGKLTSGALLPGSRLSNRKVAKEIGISFTPVREALNRLVSEGYLKYSAGVGVFVPEVTRQEIEELYELREMLECSIMAKVCGKLSEDVLAEMARQNDKMTELAGQMQEVKEPSEHKVLSEKFTLADSAFHMTLIRSANNRLLLEMLSELRMKSQIRRSGMRSELSIVRHRFENEAAEHVQKTKCEHRMILDILRRDDAEEARRIMSEHIRRGLGLALSAHDRRYMDNSPKMLGGYSI